MSPCDGVAAAPDYTGQEVLSLWRGLMIVPPPRPRMAAIAQGVAEKHGLSLEGLRSSSRSRAVVHPRQEAMAKMYDTGRFSNGQIGLYFDRDHTTVIHARQQYARRARQASMGGR